MWLWMAGALSAAAACLARSEYEKKHFVTDVYDIRSEKLKGPERKLVFLSDLHDNRFGPDHAELIRAIDRIGPDAVLVGGDMMVCKGKREIGTALSLMRRLASRYPVFYGNGNHELRMKRKREVYGDQYDIYRRELLSCGIRLLENDSAVFQDDLRITGIDLEKAYYEKFSDKELTAAEICRKAGRADGRRFQILLAHSPAYFQAYSRWGADLALAGHFHGGTIRLPWLGGVMTPQFQFFSPWCGGMFEKGGRRMIVSRGLGTHSINIRLNNRPQIVAVRLIPGAVRPRIGANTRRTWKHGRK